MTIQSRRVSYTYNLGILFENVVSCNERRPAIRFVDDGVVSYGKLNVLTNKIASFLVYKGLKKGDVLGIVHNKSKEAYACMLASLKLGVTYTNLDGESPVKRLGKIVLVCKPSLVVGDVSTLEKLKGIPGVEVCSFEDVLGDITSHIDTLSGMMKVSGDTAAYLMFTSGSTGFPKGVVITHANLLNFINWSRFTFNVTCEDVFTNINPMHFDNSVFDFYSSLFTGASFVPISESLLKNPRKIINALNRVGPTIWFSVPSMLIYTLTLRAFKKEDLKTLKRFVFGGEGFPKNQLRKLWALFGDRVEFVNVYGPTECTCICSSYVVSEDDMINDSLLPLGVIAPNFFHHILDKNLSEVEDGVGELFLGGPNVGAGYYNDLEKTSAAFVQNPFVDVYQDVMYKTGDLVRFCTDDQKIYFCGRNDNQIKRMGYRIELEEIEAALASLDSIDENAVVFQCSDGPGKITAHVAPENVNCDALLKDLRVLLPSYMVPDNVECWPVLPKNRNGKIDRLELKK